MSVLRVLATNGGDDALPGAELWFAPDWLQARQADALFAELRDSIEWETHRIRLFGREVDSPRRSSWIGDEGASYTYSGTRFQPRPWPQALADVRRRLAHELGCEFNSVLANRYRNGRDYMGWHSDNESALGPRPIIASLSLGATRRFVLRHRQQLSQKFELSLTHGSLLVMRGDTQANYRHGLPRTARPVGERINLTFRMIVLP
ncbi:alpha-ketoglutarate-dependent dioxygenase AlkB family protein [Pseudoxanthomonas sacheonensis]|uniref:Alkylated DNA repair dioxygenase AlkB n=1 Tax=Pseudoxanthomonas sacheonensis TaxID=443615 RepID=A0ABU1RYI3_9GAMM|nr:alpha-ketoglutarate-dependent dioxygenase AlkB [Pseudoxanthomonas sacheonensis]MDR6843199.1 alkylated DNA repair dioxygenase AlkB [Pseudoxanthomonas sacheonensis]